ncbi:MAG: bifunctional phosphopantothenoylcysteine decarboxylase/phosphopantothenate--cysteine ligase CoaBC [Candidatus Hecatellales archaeon]|nr:MAG: bifunctional phosphopantothenoylcysteine decarboxylase/phosphopantothenate--cysteine ligase CoaBC [Candidatus Hecatellales archaeon]
MWSFSHPSKSLIGSESRRLEGRRIVLAVTGSVAVIEAPVLARRLMRLGAEVYPVMTPKAKAMLSPEILEWATGNPAVTEITGKIENVAAFLKPPEGTPADLMLIAPATANTLAKLAHGIYDNAVTGFALAAMGAGIPVILAPAMHHQLLSSPATQRNLEALQEAGFEIVKPKVEEGKAKMADVEDIVEAAVRRLTPKTLEGFRLLVTAGPTREPLDPVRVITNRSSGRMGVALAAEALRRGAEVTLIYGPGSARPPPEARTVRVETAGEMFEVAVKELKSGGYHAFLAAAAMADYEAEQPSRSKIPTSKFRKLTVKLKATPKLVDEVKRCSPQTFLVAFKAEYKVSLRELKRRALERLKACKADLIVANDVSKPGAGFQAGEIEALIVDRRGKAVRLPRMSKEEAARRILDLVEERLKAEGRKLT